jgi:glutamate synthase (ferredoxin)
MRWAVTDDGLVTCASEAGAVPLPAGSRVRRGRLGPGEMLAVDASGGGFEIDGAIKHRLARRRPYTRWLATGRRAYDAGEPVLPGTSDLRPRQSVAAWTREDLSLVLRPAASSGHEPVSSMGDDTALPPLAGRDRPLWTCFRQRFAQVTNPAIDHLREREVMSLRTLLGPRSPLLDEGPAAARLVELDSFFLLPSILPALRAFTLDTSLAEGEGLAASCGRLAAAAEDAVRGGASMLVLSDARVADGRAVTPVLLAVAAVQRRLVEAGLRQRASLLVDSDEPRDSHHFACLLGFGADAICPRLALETVAQLAGDDKLGGDHPSADEAQRRYRASVEEGVLKVLSRLGISDLDSYRGAGLFEVIGLGADVLSACFPETPALEGSLDFAALDRAARSRREADELENPGYVKFRKGGEPHATGTDVVAAAHALRKAVRGEDRKRYDRFAELVNTRDPLELRDLLELVPAAEPVPLAEVEPVESIVRRFSGGAMSHGSLSAEAHETVAIALNRLGARSNSGEGGEDPARYGTERGSRIKQIASGRFGVTAAYAMSADELQIKIAQGSKPGEGGQLPGHKVTDEIASLRHTREGVGLISPPPHHDIYSIEDLAQLVFDLKQVNPRADVSVKLVAEAGVGLVAAGVAKALADVVHVAGADGGTGASPLSSIKNVGAPWELGLAETQRTLVTEGLRGRVRVRVDGWHQDRARRRDRRPARRRRGLVRDGVAARGRLPARPLVPPRHVPGRDRDSAARAAREVRRDAGAGRGLPALRRRGGARAPRVARAAAVRGRRRPRRPAASARCRCARRRGSARRERRWVCGRASARGGRRLARRTARARRCSCRRGGAHRRAVLRDLERRSRGRCAAGRDDRRREDGRARPRDLHRLGGPELRRLPRLRRSPDARRRGERLRRQVDVGRPHLDPPAGRRRGRSGAARQRCALRRDGGQLFVAGSAGRAVRGSELGRNRGRRGRRLAPL